tara:strand:- start:9 stop:1766 length:1758 start_codon:yes stop_codon:yes gene_type:complete
MVSIGTNTSINFIIQSTIWLLLFLMIPKGNNENKFSLKHSLIIPFVFLIQYLGENRFYLKENIIHNIDLVPNNFYLLSKLIFLILVVIICQDIFKSRVENIINYFPFMFFIVGTYSGMNLNIYLIVFSFLGIQSLKGRSSFKKLDIVYFLLSAFWIFNTPNNDYFFDGDKLRGFTNSTFNLTSQIFWILTFYLLCKGLIFVVKESLNFIKIENVAKSFLISGSLIIFFGFIGSNYPIFNFINYYIFGQNKRGMKEFTSIAGNTWRGFSSSAESIGEFYGLSILIIAYLIIIKKNKVANPFFLLLIPVSYGLYRSNNFAAILSLIFTIAIILLIRTTVLDKNKKNIMLVCGFLIFTTFLIYILNNDYDYLSTELVYEATLHQDFYADPNSYKSFLEVEQKMIERDLNSILNNEQNFLNASTSYVFIVNLFTQGINIPFIPNFIAFLSIISLMINRTEMWGIFVAKFNPSVLESLFGTGPLQLNKYLAEHNVRLDLPNNRLQELFLPHSSLLDILIFFGLFGLFTFLGLSAYLFMKKETNRLLKIICFYLIINLLKSDSILYLNSFCLIFFSFSYLFFYKGIEINEK